MSQMSRRQFMASVSALSTAAIATTASGANSLNLRIGAVLPLGGQGAQITAAGLHDVAAIAQHGLLMGVEETQKNADLFGHQIDVLIANAPSDASVERAAWRLVQHDRVSVLIGGFGPTDAAILVRVAQETGTLFLNIAATADRLRDQCLSQTFHLEASAAMYIDALVGWFVRAGLRKWFIVSQNDDEGQNRFSHMQRALSDRHWGGKVVGHGSVEADSREFGPILKDIRNSSPDVVVMLTDWLTQLRFAARYEAEGIEIPITGFPEASTQTRDYYSRLVQAAPRTGAGHRASLWEPTLDAYGARELNARFAARWGRPMDAVAWSGYQAVKIAFDAAQFCGATNGVALAQFLAQSTSVFDVHKGIGVSFRPWDHQLRQSLYLVRLNHRMQTHQDLESLRKRAHLVGELPAIYMPGTDPTERLDQLGNLTSKQECSR